MTMRSRSELDGHLAAAELAHGDDDRARRRAGRRGGVAKSAMTTGQSAREHRVGDGGIGGGGRLGLGEAAQEVDADAEVALLHPVAGGVERRLVVARPRSRSARLARSSERRRAAGRSRRLITASSTPALAAEVAGELRRRCRRCRRGGRGAAGSPPSARRSARPRAGARGRRRARRAPRRGWRRRRCGGGARARGGGRWRGRARCGSAGRRAQAGMRARGGLGVGEDRLGGGRVGGARSGDEEGLGQRLHAWRGGRRASALEGRGVGAAEGGEAGEARRGSRAGAGSGRPRASAGGARARGGRRRPARARRRRPRPSPPPARRPWTPSPRWRPRAGSSARPPRRWPTPTTPTGRSSTGCRCSTTPRPSASPRARPSSPGSPPSAASRSPRPSRPTLAARLADVQALTEPFFVPGRRQPHDAPAPPEHLRRPRGRHRAHRRLVAAARAPQRAGPRDLPPPRARAHAPHRRRRQPRRRARLARRLPLAPAGGGADFSLMQANPPLLDLLVDICGPRPSSPATSAPRQRPRRGDQPRLLPAAPRRPELRADLAGRLRRPPTTRRR